MKTIISILLIFLSIGCGRVVKVEQGPVAILDISPEELAGIYEEAEISYKNKDYADAVNKYRLYLAQRPQNIARASYRLGRAAYEINDFGRVIQPLRVIVADKEYSDLYPDAAKWLGLAYYHISDYVNAAGVLEDYWQGSWTGCSSEILAALADSLYELEDYQSARKWYGVMADKYSDEEDLVAYRLGLLNVKLGDNDSARENLERVKNMPPVKQARAWFCLGQIARKDGQVKDALEYDLAALKLLVEEDSPIAADIEREVLQLIDASSASELMPLESNYLDIFPGGHIIFRLASVAYRKGNNPIAKAYLYRFFRDFPQHPRLREARSILSRIYLRAETDRLGIILPLSGQYSIYGDRVLQGVMLAIEEENKLRENKIALFIKDSQGNPDIAAAAVRELVEDERVLAIIGPVLSHTALKAAPIAQLLSCPLITPSAGAEDIPQIGTYIFRNILTPVHQAHTLAEFAVGRMCLNEFAVLYPNNLYGEELKELFSKKVQDLGGKIIFTDSYGVDDTDFKEQVLGISEQEPQAIFIPDFYDKVVMIAPQIVFYSREEMIDDDDFDLLGEEEDLSLLGDEPIPHAGRRVRDEDGSDQEDIEDDSEDSQDIWRPFSWDPDNPLFPGGEMIKAPARPPIQLLGASGWYSDKLIKQGGKYVEEAVFTSGFFLDSHAPEVRRFVGAFSERFGEKPNLLASQSYDATRMIIATIKRGAKTHEEVRDELAGLRNFPGVTGKTGMDESGESTKEIYILGVKKKKLVQLSGREKWLCRGGEDIDLGQMEDFQKVKISQGIDYEGTPAGRPETDIERHLPYPPKQPDEPKQPQVIPTKPAIPSFFPPLEKKTPVLRDDLFELEDNF